jgi:SAM-dependent methyltransferase
MPVQSCVTAYPEEMIQRILELKDPTYLCDEILREESPDYVQRALYFDLLSYCDPQDFAGRRLLDFGCGAGASTMILARMFPQSCIVGIELEERLLSIAKLRARHYGYDNVELLLSPSPQSLPDDLGTFDFVVLSAVYEHLLPAERCAVLRQIWDSLRVGGTLFLNQTPSRYFPVETHTTGLPLINYLPDRLALLYARSASKAKLGSSDWDELLRRGIRGGSVREIMGLLSGGAGQHRHEGAGQRALADASAQ